ncbi:MAG: SDR family oxidoreductase [Pseudomonadota bacterium]
MMHSNVLVVGANGKTGRRVEARLSAAGVTTRGVSRSTLPAFNWAQSETWATALKGMDAAYLTYHPDLSVPEAADQIHLFCDLAKAAGLKQVVLLSGRNEPGAQRAEQALKESGLTWNVIQASWFAQNFSEDFMVHDVLSGRFVIPAGTSGEPFIDADDIADVAVAALMEPGLGNRLFEVTGPRVMSFEDCTREIGAAAGFAIDLVELPLDEYLEVLRERDLPDYLVELLQELFGQLFDGRSASTAQGVREALGRPATDFSEYARKAAAAGAWNRAVTRRTA